MSQQHTSIIAVTPTDSSDPSAEHVSADPIFRVVTHQGNRYAFKLEDIFWKVIRLAATARQQRVGAFISGVLQAHPESPNKASVLRVHAAEWLSQKLVEAAAKSLSSRLPSKLVSALPVAAFVLDNDNRIVAQNDLFLDLLRGLVDKNPLHTADAVRVHFRADIGQVRQALVQQSVPFLEDRLHVQYADGSLHKSVRIIGVDTAQGTCKGLLVLVLD